MSRPVGVRKERALGFGLATILVAGVAVAAASVQAVPVKLRGALLKKAIAYDKTLRESDAVEVLVVYREQPAAEHSEIVQTFNELSMVSRAVAHADLEANLGPASVIYVSPDSGSVRELSRKHGILTIGGDYPLVESGEIAIGVGMQDKKPKIFVNRTELRESGHELSSKLLQLATLIE